MKTVVLGEPPTVLASLIAQRQRLGLDRRDEIWQGDYHMSPAPSFEHAHVGSLLVTLFEPFAKGAGLVGSLDFTLGSPGDFRVPDLGLHRGTPSGVWLSTAAIVVEVRSPDDESYAKLDFYFAHEVEEVLIVELSTKTIHWYVRGASEFEASDASALLGVSAFDVAGALGW